MSFWSWIKRALGDGTVPLSPRDVEWQRAQMRSGARPPPKKPPTPGRS
jgi:hypothetical protein